MTIRRLGYALNVSVLAALLTACSSASSPIVSSTSAPPLAASGIDPTYLNRIQTAAIVQPTVRGPNATCRSAWHCGNLYVSDLGARAVKALNNVHYTPSGSVFARTPDGVWTDTAHNLYVANFVNAAGNGYIQEHACTVQHCNRETKFFYRAGLADPVAVTTDTEGNVYAVDYATGSIVEFPQGVDRVSAACALLGNPEGIAVDSTTGNVFVSFNRLGSGLIIEFPHGLAGCHGRVLGAAVDFAGGVILDPDKNLVVADQRASEVDVIAPPYNRIKRRCGSGFVDPVHLALTKRLSRLYVSDPASANVQIYHYPACTPVTTLSGPIVVPMGVTDSYNFVP